MKIWGVLSIIVLIIVSISTGVYKVNTYINAKVQTKYNQRIAEFMIDKQNRALLEWKINTTLYDKNKDKNKDKINKDIEKVVIKDSSCEEKIETLENLINLVYMDTK